MTKFSWEPSSGGSLLLRVTKGSKTTTWTIKKTTKTSELVKLFTEITRELDVQVANWYNDDQGNFQPGWAPLVETVRTVDQEEMDQITEKMSRAEQARVVASLSASAGKWYAEDLSDLELRTLGKGDPE